MTLRQPILAALALALSATGGTGCEGSAGGFTHAVAESRLTSAVTSRVAAGALTTERTVDVTRVQECRGGLIGLSIGSGLRGDQGRPVLTALYLKAPSTIAPGEYPIAFAGGRWDSSWTLDGTLTPDPSRSIAPFGMSGEAQGTVLGRVKIDARDIATDGTRKISGTVAATIAGSDAAHRVEVTASFSVTYPATDGCP